MEGKKKKCPCRQGLVTKEVASQVDLAELAKMIEVVKSVEACSLGVVTVGVSNDTDAVDTEAVRLNSGQLRTGRESEAVPVGNRLEQIQDGVEAVDILNTDEDNVVRVGEVEGSDNDVNLDMSDVDIVLKYECVSMDEDESSDRECEERPPSPMEIPISSTRTGTKEADLPDDKKLIQEYLDKLRGIDLYRKPVEPGSTRKRKAPKDVQYWLSVLNTSAKVKAMCITIKKMGSCYEKVLKKKDANSVDKLKKYMKETFMLRYQDLYNIKKKFTEVATVYPGLKVFECLKQEYDMVYKRRIRIKQLKLKLSKHFERLVRKTNPESLKSAWAKKALIAFKENPDAHSSSIVGCLLHSDLATEGKAFGRTLQTKVIPRKKQPAIYLKIKVRNNDMYMWGSNTSVKVIFEDKALSKVRGVFNGLIMLYAYYWVFYIDYSDTDRELFQLFEELGGTE